MVDLDMSSQTKWFAIKADIRDLTATSFAFAAHKTMYDGKHVAVGDRIFLFDSETSGGAGLFARGIVSRAEAVPRSAALRVRRRVSRSLSNGMEAARNHWGVRNFVRSAAWPMAPPRPSSISSCIDRRPTRSSGLPTAPENFWTR